MSSIASQRSLLLVLSGASLAALFVWYLQFNRRRSLRRIHPFEDSNTSVKSEHMDDTTEPKLNECALKENTNQQVPEDYHSSQRCGVISETSTQVITPVMSTMPGSETLGSIDSATAFEGSETVSCFAKDSPSVFDDSEDEAKPGRIEENSASIRSQIEELKVLGTAVDQQLMLDVSHQAEPEAFSWSDEMERSYMESCRSEEQEHVQNDGNAANGGSGDYTTSDSPGVASQNSEIPSGARTGTMSPLPVALPLTITSLHSSKNLRRRSSGSSAQSVSCAASTSSASNCEAVSSQDSGRATGGLASSLSPMDESGEVLPMYEFEIPNTLVGLIIGIKGKTIKELSTRTDVRMLIRQHHTPEKVDTHQICQVRGKREQINRCLQMLRRRFPPARFPELNLQPVLPPPLASNLFDALATQPSWLTLPDAIPCEVVCSSIIDPGHFFLQQPTHPSFSSLSHLDMYMIRLYSQGSDIPDLPKPCQTGLLCAAPVLGAWFRAVTVSYHPDNDEVMLRFVDYGGYTRLPRSELRQIRTDLMSLPFQAIECYLAHVQPIDGTWQWGEAAFTHFQKLCMGKVMNATVVGFNVHDKVPMVELTVVDEEGKTIRVDKELMDAGFAKASDPSKLQKVTSTKARPLPTITTPMVAAV